LIDIATIGLAVDTKDVKNAARDLDNLTKAGDKASHSADGMGKSYHQAMSLVSKGILGAVSGFISLTAIISKFTRETINASNEQAQLTAVLKSTGQAAGFSADQLNKMSSALSNSSVFSQGEVTRAQTRLLSYTGVVGQQFPQAMQAVIDMSARMGMSLESSAETIGRALDIPSQGLTALQRQGFRFTESQKDLVIELENTGRVAEAQGIVLKALESSYGGAANAAKNTLGGALKDLTNTISDMFVLNSTKATVFTGLINQLTGAIKLLGDETLKSKTNLDNFLPAYRKYRETMDLENPNDGFVFKENDKVTGNEIRTIFDDIAEKAVRFRESNPFADRESRLENYNKKMAELSELLQFGSITQQEFNRYQKQFSEEIKVKTEKAKDYNKTLQDEIKSQSMINQLMIEGMNIEEARTRVTEAKKGASVDTIESLLKQQSLQAELLEVEERKLARTRAIITEQEDHRKAELKRIEDQSRANKKASEEYLRTVKKAEEDRRREFERTSQLFSQSLTDAIFRGFEDGKSFARNFRDTLINTFRTLVLQPIVKFIVDSSGITGALSSIGGAFTGQSGGGIGGLFSTIKDVFNSGNASIVSSIESLGVFLSDGPFKSLGGLIGQYSAQIANVLPYAGAFAQLLSGDAKGAAFTAVGTALGSFFGPIGGAIGGFLGNAIGGLFGGKDYKRFGTTVSGTSTADGYRKTGQGIIYDRPIAAAAGPLNDLNKSFSDTVQALFAAFDIESTLNTSSGVYQRGKSKKSGGVFNASVDGQSIGGLEVVLRKADMQQVYAALVDKVFGEGLVKVIQASSLSDGIKKFFDGLTKKEDVAAAIQTLMTLNLALKDLPPVFDAIRNAIDTTAYKTSIPQLQQNFANLATFTSLFYTEAENFATFTKQLTTQFDNLNVGLPATAQAFRELVESINVVDEATSNQFNSLVALAPAAKQYYDYLEQQRKSLEDLNRAAANNLNRGLFSTSADFASAQASIATGGTGSEFYAGYRNQSETTIALLEEIKMLRKDNADMKITMEAVAKYTYDTAKIQRQWNGDGLPAERVI